VASSRSNKYFELKMQGALKSTGSFELAFFPVCQNYIKYTVSGMCFETSFFEIAHGNQI